MTVAVDGAAARGLRAAMRELESYSRLIIGRPLRPYQLEAGRAITQAVRRREGRTFSVMMSRQAGKNELSAQVEAYLLTLRSGIGGTIVKCAPTFQPQVVTSMLRLKEALQNPLAEVMPVEGERGYILGLGKAKAFFLSAEPNARVVGATASIALEVDEAQDVDAEKHDRDFAPMAASTNATRIYYGTAWRDDDLLQGMKEANLALERRDGVQRHFEYPWWVVAEHNAEYGAFVEGERERLGATHPAFLTQYELKPVSAAGALFDDEHLRRLRGEHSRLRAPRSGCVYVAGVDVAGSAELHGDGQGGADRDSTAIVIAEVEVFGRGATALGRAHRSPHGEGEGTLAGALGKDDWDDTHEMSSSPEPEIRVVELIEWRGRAHQEQYRDLLRLLDGVWGCRAIAFDASGAGEWPCAFLRGRLGPRVMPVVFSGPRKSSLGFELLAAVNAGRLTVYRAEADDAEARDLWGQARAMRRTMRESGVMGWSARRGRDDYIAALALAVHAAGRVRPPPAFVVTVAPDPMDTVLKGGM